MKKNYFFLFCVLLLMMAAPANIVAQSTTSKVYVGYAKYDDQIWEYDGISLPFDSKAGAAILLTHDMLEPYVGGVIKSIRVGWDDQKTKGNYDCFIRKDFHSEDLSTGSKQVSFGWNTVTMSEYEIPADVNQLVVGFTTTLKKDVCSIPLVYPQYVKHSCYLWVDGDFDSQGHPNWVDMSPNQKFRTLPILLVIQDAKGEFNFVPVINSYVDDGVMLAGKAGDCLMSIKNVGSQTIKSVEVTTRQGEDVYSKLVTFTNSNIASGKTSSPIMLPLYCFRSGEAEVSITKVNGKAVQKEAKVTTNLLAIPNDVAAQYPRRPLVEYFESENSYFSPRYYDECIAPAIRSYKSRITFVCQHLDDQFMTGDDDATTLALLLCSKDSSIVTIPAEAIDRGMSTDYISYQIAGARMSPMFDCLYEPNGAKAIKAALEHPTFVDVETSGVMENDGETVVIGVEGEVAAGILPEGEHPRLTVYLMERNVFSDSQMFWTDKEKEEHKGEYTHVNVIREILSSTEGDPIAASGKISEHYSTQIAPDWNVENLYIVAFVHRDGKLGGRGMQVFNSAEGEIIPVGVKDLPTLNTEPSTLNTFDLSGRRIQPSQMRPGIYIINGKKVVK